MDNKIKEALQTLRDAGYYVENLWSIEDVDNDDLNNEEKLDILHNSIHRDYVYRIINEAIYDELEIYMEVKNWKP